MAKKKKQQKRALWTIPLILLIPTVLFYSLYLALRPSHRHQAKKQATTQEKQVTAVKKRKHKRKKRWKKKNHSFSEKEEAAYQAFLDKAEELKNQGDQEKILVKKEELYLLALAELAHMKKVRPSFISSKRALVADIRDELTKYSTLPIKIGDSKKTITRLLGKAEREQVDEDYFPIGSVINLFYFDDAVVIAINEEKAFSIDVHSNFIGSFFGIKIGDPLTKIQALYRGKKEVVASCNFGYRSDEEWQLNFLFVDNDDEVDNIKQLDKAVADELAMPVM